MGMSLSARIVFGVSFGCEDEWYGNLDEEFLDEEDDEWLAANFGDIIRPSEEWSEENEEVYHEYWDKKREFLKSFPIEIGKAHCYDYCTNLGVFVKATEIEADHQAEPIDISKIVEPDEETKQVLLDVVKKTGYSGEIKMGWFLIPKYW